MEGKQTFATKGCALAGSSKEDILYYEKVTVKCVKRRNALQKWARCVVMSEKDSERVEALFIPATTITRFP
jgi:hypothetical protein